MHDDAVADARVPYRTPACIAGHGVLRRHRGAGGRRHAAHRAEGARVAGVLGQGARRARRRRAAGAGLRGGGHGAAAQQPQRRGARQRRRAPPAHLQLPRLPGRRRR